MVISTTATSYFLMGCMAQNAARAWHRIKVYHRTVSVFCFFVLFFFSHQSRKILAARDDNDVDL